MLIICISYCEYLPQPPTINLLPERVELIRTRFFLKGQLCILLYPALLPSVFLPNLLLLKSMKKYQSIGHDGAHLKIQQQVFKKKILLIDDIKAKAHTY